MNPDRATTDGQYTSTPSRRSFLQGTGALAGAGAVTALAGCLGSEPELPATASSSDPDLPVTVSVSAPYHFYRVVNEFQDQTDYHGPVWLADVTFDLAINIDDWNSEMPSKYPIRVSINGGNPNWARFFYINKNEGWYRVEDKWAIEKSEFIVDETETEHFVLGYGENDEPEPGTEYAFYLQDREAKEFHDVVSFTYDGNPKNRNLLEEIDWN